MKRRKPRMPEMPARAPRARAPRMESEASHMTRSISDLTVMGGAAIIGTGMLGALGSAMNPAPPKVP